MNVVPLWDDLHAHPRFISLLRNMGLQEQGDAATSADGVQIMYEVYGEGEPALVFVHGWCCDRSYWEAQLSYFSEKYTVVALDLTGHGESDSNRDDWTIHAFGRDVTAVVEKLDLEQVVLIGSSMGGSVMLEAALQLPKRTIGLVSVDALLNPETEFSTEEEYVRYKKDFVKAVERDVREEIFLPHSDPDLIEKIMQKLTACPPEVALPALRGALDYYNKGHYKRALGKIKIPIRAIHSKYQINTEEFKPYTNLIEGVNMPGVGHLPMLEDPDEFNRLLEGIVAEIINLSASK
jgi:pimeloyl-ACP methyl ester carboxylesterase